MRYAHAFMRVAALVGVAALLPAVAPVVKMATPRALEARTVKPAEAVVEETLPAGLPKSLVEAAEESIARQEYEASRTERGLQAPNRAHNLRTYFEPWGVRVEDRTAEGSPELVRMRTVGVGRAGRMTAFAAGDIRTMGARVENRRGNGIVEWYENGEAGLEHGYVLDRRPAGDDELRIEVAFEGGRVTMRNGGAVISTPERRFEYGKLVVEDAAGREIPSRMEEVDGVTVRLVVNDAGAVYPLVVDPLLTSTVDALLQSDQASANLGIAVSDAGDVNGDGYGDVIVAAAGYDAGQTNEGAAFIFHGGPSGIMNGNPGTANTTIESDQAGALFGAAVSSAGDVNGDGYADVVIGSNFYNAQAGGAFIFHGGPSGIASGSVAAANTSLLSGQANAWMGGSVGGGGDVNGDGYSDVVVGSQQYDLGEMDEGAVFIFHGGPSGIANGGPGTANTTLQSNQVLGVLGVSAANAGDVNGDGYSDVIAGAYFYDLGETDEGAAFVFHGGPSGVANGNPGTANATLQSDQAMAQFGSSASGAGDVNGDGYADVIVGAWQYDAGETNEGAAFVFHGGPAGVASGNPGTANAMLQSDQATAGLGVQAGVSDAGDVNGDGYGDVIVGAFAYDSGESNEGAAFVYHGGPSGIASGNPATANAILQSDVGGANLGYALSGAGDVNGDGYADVIAGAFNYSGGQSNEGAAFVALGGAEGVRSGTPATAAATLQSDQAIAQLGNSVAMAGDVNADGYGDVIIGSRLYDSGEMDEGAAFVFYGGPSGIMSGNLGTANATLQSNQAGGEMGVSVAGAGDVNGDGYADVIVGAFGYDVSQTNEGAAFVFHGGPSGIANGNPGTANATLRSDQFGAQMGISVAGAGDVNGDGYADVIVGANQYNGGQVSEGGAFVFHGGPSGIANGTPITANAVLQSDQTSAGMGVSVAGAGDVNADGYADVIVGAFQYDLGETNEGAAFVYHGGPMGVANGTPMTANATLQADQANAIMGISAAGAGDVNGDGYADVIVGASQYDLGETNEGAAFVYHGGPMGVANGTPMTANAVLQSDQGAARMGQSVAGAGDVNGDGYADVIVGADRYDAGQTDEGAAFVFHGGSAGVLSGNPAAANATLQSDLSTGWMGTSVAGAGDVNGDGYADVIVGALAYEASETDEGAVFVFLGNGDGFGRAVRSRQLRGNGDMTNVEPWGSSLDLDDFQVRMTATHPQGRGRVKLEIQAVPAGENWGGPNSVTVVSSTWTDVTATSTGVTLTETVAGLDPSTLYRWRARVLHAPFAFMNAPVNPAHGPWRRLRGQAVEADIRTGAPCVLTCPANITMNAAMGQCAVTVNYAAPTTTGVCGVVTCMPASGSSFPVGVTTVTCSEPGGQMCTFTVTVVDNQAPTVTCPSNVTTNAGAGQCSAVVNYTTPTAVDNCPGATVNCVPASGSTFTVGTTTVVCTATDASNNTGQCTFTVTVVDNQAPTVVCPANVATFADTGAGAIVAFATPAAVDNCPGATVMCAPMPGSLFAVGTTTVVCTATDASSNTGQCTFTVTVTLPEDSVGTVNSSGAWFLNNGIGNGPADVTFFFGLGTDIPVTGDWDGDGDDTAGVYRPSTSEFFLKNTNANGGPDLSFQFGTAGFGFVPVVGDWNGDGMTTIGLYQPSTGAFFLKNTNAAGDADATFFFGPSGLNLTPVIGDWDGNGTDGIGLYDVNIGSWLLRNALSSGPAEAIVFFGDGGLGYRPMTGDWNDDGVDGIGVYVPGVSGMFLRYAPTTGAADRLLFFGSPNSRPVAGNWDNLP